MKGLSGVTEPYHHEANGTNKTFGRDLYESHLFACLYAGINISGGNAEAFPGQVRSCCSVIVVVVVVVAVVVVVVVVVGTISIINTGINI